MAWARSRLTTVAHPHLAGTMASAAPVSLRSGTPGPSTLIAWPESWTRTGWLGPLEALTAAGGEADARPPGPDAPAVPGCPAAGPEFPVPWLAGDGPAKPEKFGFALNIVSTMPAIIARTRHPAMSGTTIPLRRIGARQRSLR